MWWGTHQQALQKCSKSCTHNNAADGQRALHTYLALSMNPALKHVMVWGYTEYLLFWLCIQVLVGRQRRGEQLRGVCDVVVVMGDAYPLAVGRGRGRSLHADLLQALVLWGRNSDIQVLFNLQIWIWGVDTWSKKKKLIKLFLSQNNDISLFTGQLILDKLSFLLLYCWVCQSKYQNHRSLMQDSPGWPPTLSTKIIVLVSPAKLD